MGEVNNQFPIRQQQTFAFNKSNSPFGEGLRTHRLDTLSDENKAQLTSAAKVALKDPSSPEAEAFNNVGLTRDNVINIADGKISEVGPLPSANVNNLVAVAEKTKPQSEGTDPVIMGRATDITNESSQGLRDKEELALADAAWFGNANVIPEELNNDNVVADNSITDATIIGEQAGGIGNDVVTLNGIDGVSFDGSQINGSLDGLSFEPVGQEQQQALSQGLGNLVT